MAVLSKLSCIAVAGSLTLGAGSAWASEYWEYQDWSVAVEERITEEHDWRDCSAWTGGDGEPIIRLEVTRDDIGPPETYPQLHYREIAPRQYPTHVVHGQAVGFIIDRQAVFYAIADGDINDEGLAEVTALARWNDALNLIRWMQAGTTLDVHIVRPYDGGETALRASLAGFTAAYGKMMDECGFPLELRELEIDYN
ncbi:invasion associated locus B family protein [Phaeobacter italicus]|uniref:hypothetical protein n=1 Tax=Phaeobacter italicus TaxID=481446 RepID=UPI001C9827B9|nr:hypothetical protein [Phaeobacter italicus]MBY6044724.1 hypothetical protein [Phaeobacter italicus]